jgi:protein SCO1/2
MHSKGREDVMRWLVLTIVVWAAALAGGPVRPAADAGAMTPMKEGEYRTWHANGQLAEVRRYVSGREAGLQQSWTPEGVLYLNYEVRNGRRYGLVNSRPCAPVEDEPALPFYGDRTFTPSWTPVPHSVTDHLASDTPFLTQSGQAFTPATLKGRVHVVSFIFTQCAAICPPLVASLKKVQAATEANDVALVSYSVDPANDTVPVLRDFGESRRINPARWLLLTGTRDGVHTVARDLYFADDEGMRRTLANPNAFLHTEKLVLVDVEGRIRGVYNGTQPFEIQKLLEDLRALI